MCTVGYDAVVVLPAGVVILALLVKAMVWMCWF